jgi:hypothetical protein
MRWAVYLGRDCDQSEKEKAMKRVLAFIIDWLPVTVFFLLWALTWLPRDACVGAVCKL